MPIYPLRKLNPSAEPSPVRRVAGRDPQAARGRRGPLGAVPPHADGPLLSAPRGRQSGESSPGRTGGAGADGRAQRHAGAGILRRGGRGEVLRAQAAAVDVADVRPQPPGRQNVHVGVRFRRMLAPFIFKRVGRNFKSFHFVEFSFGYNLEVGDDVVVHRNVLLDDRGGIVLGNGVIDQRLRQHLLAHALHRRPARRQRPADGPRGRRAHHLPRHGAGRHARGRERHGGRHGLATKDVRPFHVNVGIPAKSVRVKPNAPPEAYKLTLRQARRAEAAPTGAGED